MLVKVIAGIVLGAAAVATTVAVVKATSKKYATTNEEVNEEDESVLKKIKKAAQKKALDILQFVINHQEQIEAATTVIGLVAGVAEIGSYVKSMKDHNEILTRLDKIERDAYGNGYSDSRDDHLKDIIEAANTKKPLDFIIDSGNDKVAIKHFKVEEVIG